jgi:hypothetical protein
MPSGAGAGVGMGVEVGASVAVTGVGGAVMGSTATASVVAATGTTTGVVGKPAVVDGMPAGVTEGTGVGVKIAGICARVSTTAVGCARERWPKTMAAIVDAITITAASPSKSRFVRELRSMIYCACGKR